VTEKNWKVLYNHFKGSSCIHRFCTVLKLRRFSQDVRCGEEGGKGALQACCHWRFEPAKTMPRINLIS